MQINLQVPNLAKLSEFDLKMSLAAKLYEDRKLSLGHCAQIAGLSKRTFAEMLGKYGVSLFSQTADELKADIENARQLFR
jgi:predicted HTH domain antitoxin